MRLQGFRRLFAASLLLMAGWSSLVGTQTVEAAPWLVGGGTSATGFIGGTNGDFTTFDFTSATLSVDTNFGMMQNVDPPTASWTVTMIALTNLQVPSSGIYSSDPISNLVTLSEPGGRTFTFSSSGAALLTGLGGSPFTDAVFGVGFYGFLSDGTTSYQSEFALFLNPDGSFGDAAWAMYAVAPQSVPEPSTLVIFGAGVLGMGWQVRRRRRLQAAC